VYQHLQMYKYQLGQMLSMIYLSRDFDPIMKVWLTKQLRMTAIIILISLCFSFVFFDFFILVVGLVFSLFYFAIQIRRIYSYSERMKQMIRKELIDWLHRLYIRLAAGETLWVAIERSKICEVEQHLQPFHFLLNQAFLSKQNNGSLQNICQYLQDHCKLNELHHVTIMILAHQKQGGPMLLGALHESITKLTQQRTVELKKKGEQASAKLLFPMVIMLMVTLSIIAAPALFFIQQT
jgi:tight adherence protein C